jgi:uncharacterized membrane protein YobD (UPF0266 family)
MLRKKKQVKKTKNERTLIYQSKPLEKIEWEAPDFVYYQKDEYWYLGLVIMAIASLMFYVTVKNFSLNWQDYLLITILILFFAVFHLYSKQEPVKTKVILAQDGITYRDKFFSYDKLKSFWIVEEPHPFLYFEEAKLYSINPITILLENQQIHEVENFLMRYLPYHPTAKEHFVEKFNRFVKF